MRTSIDREVGVPGVDFPGLSPRFGPGLEGVLVRKAAKKGLSENRGVVYPTTRLRRGRVDPVRRSHVGGRLRGPSRTPVERSVRETGDRRPGGDSPNAA